MSVQQTSSCGPDYDRCSYGSSRLAFRGPYRVPQAIDVAVLGGTETFGKFIPAPYPALLEQAIGRPVVNLGALNAGVDSFCNDPVIEDVAHHARVAVVQITGAHGLSNAFYRVHARRNDRFVGATPARADAFPGVDLADCNFVRHLLEKLYAADPARFGEVVGELQRTWVTQMKRLVARLAMPTVLLWLSDHEPPEEGECELAPSAMDPLFVTKDMVHKVVSVADGLVEVSGPYGSGSDLAAMAFGEVDLPATKNTPGPSFHARAAQQLGLALSPVR